MLARAPLAFLQLDLRSLPVGLHLLCIPRLFQIRRASTREDSKFTRAPCFKRVIMFAASPLVRLATFSGKEDSASTSSDFAACRPHRLATHAFWLTVAGCRLHLADRSSLCKRVSDQLSGQVAQLACPNANGPCTILLVAYVSQPRMACERSSASKTRRLCWKGANLVAILNARLIAGAK
jgi:hypothetical protein